MDISVIVVSYNTQKLLQDCLRSIIKHSAGLTYEIIVVDNASQDGSAEIIKHKFPKVILISNKKNYGFGKANNIGVKRAKGKYIFMLNSDTRFSQNSLKKLIDEAAKNPNLGAISPQLKNEDNSIQQSVGFFPNIPQIIYWMSFLDDLPFGAILNPYHVDHTYFYQDKQLIDWTTAAAILIPRKVFDQINGFDENIFMYGEDVELCYRIKKAGYSILYTPVTSITHIGRGSHKKDTKAAFVSEYKGLIYFYKKYRSGLALQILRVFLKIGALLRIIIFGVQGRKKLSKDYVEAFKVV